MNKLHKNKKNIPIHDLPQKPTQDFDFKLYHLKGEYARNKNLSSMPGETNVPHRHNFYEVCFFTRGGGHHEIDFRKFDIREFSIHFISPGQIHHLVGTGENQGYVLAFSTAFLLGENEENAAWLAKLPFFNPLQGPQTLKLDQSDYYDLLNLIEHIKRDEARMGKSARGIIRYYIKIVLGKCNYFFSLDKESGKLIEDPTLKLVGKFKHLVEMHFANLHQVQEYSKKLAITPGHLNRCCKQITGKNASDVILQRIVLEAKRLLLFTGKTSKEIAYSLHFEDPSYFSRIFKKKTGYSPTTFRNSMREKYHQ